ncbi:MAG: amidohydrolase family protein [Chloroflexi bacterium]|nr:amidohydrolase family protein [Chloroflexota bacterium]MCL5074428.1 amidohydrolase family protein [Chloroflexota bacterium]
MGYVVVTNIGKLVTGDVLNSLSEATTILIKDGVIEKIGTERDIDVRNADRVIDVNGMTICPGLIDAHVHNTLDDWAPMQNEIGWMENALWLGTTTIISEGEQGPGFPRFFDDAVGVKATAILARRVFDRYRPGGALKMHGGAVVLVNGLTEEDFKEMAEAGVWLVAEIGGGGLWRPEDVKPMVQWAKKYEMIVSMHFGARSIPGSSTVSAEEIIEVGPDKIAHANGGSTAAPWELTRRLIDETEIPLEMIHNGNHKMMHRIVKRCQERGELHRIVLGTDCPTGQGAIPNAITRTIVFISSLDEIPADKVIAMATGNTADLYHLNRGKVEVGREADLLAIDCPPGSVGKDALEAIQAGDTPGVAMVMVDGRIISIKGRDGRPTLRNIKVNGVEMAISNINDYLFGPPHPGFNVYEIPFAI